MIVTPVPDSTSIESNSSELSPIEAAFLERSSSGVYDNCMDQLLGLLTTTVLAMVTYNKDFQHCVQPYTGNLTYLFKDSNSEYETILIREILHDFKGTKFSAKGTHYAGTAIHVHPPCIQLCLALTPIHPFQLFFTDNKTKVKCAFALGKLLYSDKHLAILFNNQIVTLEDVVDNDKAEMLWLQKVG